MSSARLLKAIPFASLVLTFACGGDVPTKVTPVDPPKPVVAGVVLAAPTQIYVGRTDSVRAEARTSTGTAIAGKTFTYASTNTSAITISNDGVIHAVAPGSATISATSDGFTGSANVTAIDPSLTTLSIAALSGPLYIGTTAQMIATGRDSSNAIIPIREITWTSSRPTVATVSATGIVTAVSIGTTVIAASGITVTEASATTTVTVVPVPVASVEIVAPTDSIARLSTLVPIVAIARDSAGHALTRPFTYASSNVDVARLDAFGNIIATGEGDVTITVSCEGKSASMKFFVPTLHGIHLVVVGSTPQNNIQAYSDFPGSDYRYDIAYARPNATRFGIHPEQDGTYRIRVVETQSSGVVMRLGLTKGVVVALADPSTIATVQMKPYTATITAPDTVTAGSVVTVSWVFDESLEPFPYLTGNFLNYGSGVHVPHGTQPPNGALYVSSAPFVDMSSLVPATAATSVIEASGVTRFTATFVAPATAGTLYYQVSAYASQSGNVGGSYGFAAPLVSNGESLKKMVIR